MSLHTLANHLQTAGRGEDKVLVHMTPGEVNGLQSLAMAHGGSLSINPQTGLPEAGFLSGILPMLAGAALAATGVGAPMAALMVGGAGTVATGSLSKGLMMGLGAYGGAGLGAGLMGGAASAMPAASALGTAVSPAVGAGQAITATGLAGSPAAAAAAAPTAATAAINPTADAIARASGTFTPPPAAPAISPVNTLQQGQAAYADYMAKNPVVASGGTQAVNAPAPSVNSATAFDRIKSLPGKAWDLMSGTGPEAEKARDEFIKQNKNYMLMGGLGVLGASRDDPRKPKEQQYDIYDYDWNTRKFSPSSQVPGSTGERTYFAADGGLMGLPVEQMSQQNAMSDNTRYPMAFQNTPSYATPSQRPISQNVVYPATDTDTTPYSGAERGMANGGVVALAEGGLSKQEIQNQIANIRKNPEQFIFGNVKGLSEAQSKQIKNLEAQLKTASDQPTGVSSVAPSGLTASEQKTYNDTVGKFTNYDLSKVAEPKGGFTTANVYSTYKAPILDKQKKDLTDAEALLAKYIDPKTKQAKAGYGAIVDTLRGVIDEQRTELTNAINDIYEKIPKTDIDFSDPKKAGLQNTNQTNEASAVKSLSDYVNGIPSLKGTDFATDYLNKLSTENLQKEEAAKYNTLATTLNSLSDYKTDSTGSLTEQSADVATLKTALTNAGLMDKDGKFTPAADKYTGLTNLAKSELEKQTGQVDTFNTAYARASTGIGSRNVKTTSGANREDIQAQIDAIRANLQGFGGYNQYGGSSQQLTPQQLDQIKAFEKQLNTPKQVFDPVTGTFGPEKVVPKYQPITYGSVTAIKGWDGTVKYIEPDDVTRVFEEVAGRKPTESELGTYVGTKNSIQGLANTVNTLKDLTVAQQFTDDQIQAQAKYYWGRDMTGGELANYKAKKFGNFAALRNALTSEKMYVDNLNNINKGIVEQQNKPVLPTASKVDISSAFVDTLGRKPTKKELNDYLAQNIAKADLIQKLKDSDEYAKKLYQPEEQVDEDGGVITTPTGGGTGIVPPITYKPVDYGPPPVTMTKAEMDEYTKRYAAGFTPAAYATAGSGAAAPSGTASGTSPYQPLTGPEFSIAGSLPYQDINKQLGLTGLYNQMSAKMPELQQGLNFDQSQAKPLASPFSNVTPGLVTLQSVATPQPYVPPTPVIPGGQNYSPALTPEEQALLSKYQEQNKGLAGGGMTSYNLGGYSDGGRLLKGPGDGVSDSIPATIGNRQPARLADGEFVVPARIVSELGNGSTDAGARKLYAMMERIQRARKKTVGSGRVAVKSGADNMLPA